MRLNVPEHVYQRRLERMAYHIEHKLPSIIIYHEARLIEEALRPSLWRRIKNKTMDAWIDWMLDWEWMKYKLTGKSKIYSMEESGWLNINSKDCVSSVQIFNNIIPGDGCWGWNDNIMPRDNSEPRCVCRDDRYNSPLLCPVHPRQE
jgi:hypothetical protein